MIGIAILGYGVVGAGVGKLLTEQAGRLSRAVGEEIRLKYVVDIRDVPLPAGVTLAKELDTALADADVRVVVETIGGKGIAYQYTRRALEAGRHVVSSNKELVATHGDELIPLARQKGVRYLYEAAVGGGIPVLFPIYELLCASPITRVTGIVNGTTNYILTRMKEANASFPAALGKRASWAIWRAILPLIWMVGTRAASWPFWRTPVLALSWPTTPKSPLRAFPGSPGRT